MKPSDVAAYLFLAFAWGFSFLTLLQVVDAFGWVGAVVFRSFLAAGTLLAFVYFSGRKLGFRGNWRALIIVGATTVAGQLIGLSYATPLIGTAMAAILVATIPLFSLIIAQIWGVERITPANITGLMLGFLGIFLLVGFPAVPLTPSFFIGCAACLFSCICAAYGSNYMNRYLRTTSPISITIAAFFVGGLITTPLFYWVPMPRTPQMIDYAYLALQAILMSALTYVTYFRLVASIGPTKAISVEFMVTVIAVMAGVILLNEPLTMLQLLGAGVIIAGCTLVLGLFSSKPIQIEH